VAERGKNKIRTGRECGTEEVSASDGGLNSALRVTRFNSGGGKNRQSNGSPPGRRVATRAMLSIR